MIRYHKLTGDLLNVWYDGDWNYRIKASGQMASRALDGSEQFYLGGINGVRAYGASDGYGDLGYLATAEIRRATGIEGLEAAVFIDSGAVKNKYDGTMDHLAYATPNPATGMPSLITPARLTPAPTA